MTIVATYDDTEQLGRVRLSFSGYSTAADYATVERSTDQITWETIRGGSLVGLTAGAGAIDDYEFSASVVNYYRVTAIDNANPDPVLLTPGNVATANNASVTPTLPSTAVIPVGQTMILLAAIRNSGTGTVNQPTGWTTLLNSGNVRLMYRRRATGDTDPTVTFSGGVANADTAAGIFGISNVNPALAFLSTPTLNGSAQDISTPSVQKQSTYVGVRAYWKQDDSSAGTLAGWTSMFHTGPTAGDDMTLGAVAVKFASTGTDPAQNIVITGGAAAISRGLTVTLPKATFTDQEIQSITPVVTRWRLKNPARPSLNRIIEPLPVGAIRREARAGLFEVLGRTLPVAVSDVQGARRFDLLIDVFGYSEKEDMDRRLATGTPMFLQGPAANDQMPTLYFLAGAIEYLQDATATGSYTFTIEVRECAKPGPTVAATTNTWADVVADFATWADVVLAEATWSDLVDRVQDSEVIVP